MKCPFKCSFNYSSKQGLVDHMKRVHPVQARRLHTVVGRASLQSEGFLDSSFSLADLTDIITAVTELSSGVEINSYSGRSVETTTFDTGICDTSSLSSDGGGACASE